MFRGILAVLILVQSMSLFAAETRDKEGVGLTIYMSEKQDQNYGYDRQIKEGYAVVKDWRFIDFVQGVNNVTFTDVAKYINADTVHFTSLTDPEGTFVVEQNYEYDLISTDKILEKYIDQPITIIRENKDGVATEETATLLSNTGGRFVVNRGDVKEPIELFSNYSRMRLGKLPGGLITRPTLFWTVNASKPGKHLCKVSYETNGVKWDAAYIAVMKKDDKALDLSSWVTIENNSGATYKDAEIKVVAGDVHAVIAREGNQGQYGGQQGRMKTREKSFSPQQFFEYYLYTLGRTSTVKDNSKKQIELFTPVANIPAEKILLFGDKTPLIEYNGPYTENNRGFERFAKKNVDIYVKFNNSAKAGLGIPLPKGTARVYKEDPADGSLEFIGEDSMEHSARDEDVMLRLGSSFDVVGQRTQKNFSCKYDEHWMTESFEITLRNHKDMNVQVIVRETMFRWLNWEITEKTADFVKVDSRTIHFVVPVAQNGERMITYTVKYTW